MHDAARMPPFGITVALALLAGVGSCLCLPRLPPWPLLAIALATGFALWWRPGWTRIAGALSCGFALAGLHAAFSLALQLPPSLERQDLVVSGRVIELPRHEPRRTRFLLRVDRSAAQPAPLRGKLLQLAWYDDFDVHALDPTAPRLRVAPGSRWRLHARLRAPRGLRNPGGFDSEKHALAERIAATGYVRDPEFARRLSDGRGIDAWRDRKSVV